MNMVFMDCPVCEGYGEYNCKTCYFCGGDGDGSCCSSMLKQHLEDAEEYKKLESEGDDMSGWGQ
jgi:hypothetical protein